MVKYFFPVLSIVLYLLASREYSLIYNYIILVIYILNMTFLLKRLRGNMLSYTTVFFVAFFFVNFVYPVFIFSYDPTFILEYRFSFSEIYINKGSALCLCAFSLFCAGYSTEFRKVRDVRYSINKTRYQFVTVVSYIVLLINIYLIVPQLGIGYGNAKVPFQTGSLFVMLECVLVTISCHIYADHVKNNIKVFLRIIRPHLIASALFMIIILMLGSREYVLVLVLLYLYVYNKYVKRLSIIKLSVCVVIGFVGLYYISQVRGMSGDRKYSDNLFAVKSWQSEQVSGVWNLATDLIINNRNVYVGMEYVDDPKMGYTYGIHYLPMLTAPIPFMPSVVSKIFFCGSPVDFTSQQMLTNYTRDNLGHRDLDYELGSNCVIDIYMGLGFWGVILMFFLLGRFVKYLESSKNNLPLICIYIIIYTSVLFFCRSSFFGQFRNVVWAYWLCCFILKRNSAVTLLLGK